MRADHRGVRRAVAPALIVLLAPVITSCGNLVASPNLSPSPFPSSKRPLLHRQAAAIRTVVDGLAGAVPAGGRTARTVLRNHEHQCRFHDPDDPGRAPAVLNWEYAVRLEYTGTDGAAGRDAALKDRLRRDGWALGDDFGKLIAVRRGMYLELLLSGTTGDGTLVIGGFSRCVDADGKVTAADPPISPTARPTR
ncbi:hypothetical protein [Actinomadura formosensis]|uniref:hypothetical protein n=1 Tax=Actinomadura formosensis TaxID=60706 RepID=UPI0008349E65|nr:hypothetical protein [Actinomadura formosensis]